jgi:hypothetical protein
MIILDLVRIHTIWRRRIHMWSTLVRLAALQVSENQNRNKATPQVAERRVEVNLIGYLGQPPAITKLTICSPLLINL